MVTYPPPELFTTPTHNYYKVLGDTAATYHYLDPEDAKHCTNITKEDRQEVTVTNGGVITPSLQSKIPLHKVLSNERYNTFILDEMKTGYLLSIGQLCDDKCMKMFSKSNVEILKNRIIITGTRNNHGMWSIALQSPPSQTPKVPRRSNNVANGVICLRQIKKEMVQYLSGCCLNPSPLPSILHPPPHHPEISLPVMARHDHQVDN